MNVQMTRWEMAYRKQPIVTLPQPNNVTTHGAIAAYKYSQLPTDFRQWDSKANWENAPGEGGNINFQKDSILPSSATWTPGNGNCAKQLNFTYFRAAVYIPGEVQIDSFDAVINHVDDGARMSIYNAKYPNGYVEKNKDGKLNGDSVTIDFTAHAVSGWNLLIVTQFDDCPILNNLTGGIDVSVNGHSIPPKESFPGPSCINPQFYWATRFNVTENPKMAEGVINGKTFTYTSDQNIEFSDSIYGYQRFHESGFENLPGNTRCIKNSQVTNNTLTFLTPLKDPVLLFASIGQRGRRVNVTFEQDINIEWGENIDIESNRSITGEEGYAIIKVPGNHDSISFNYSTAENWCNFLFGYEECPDS